MNLCVVRTHPQARLPARSSDSSAGYDLYSVDDVLIPSHGRALVRLGISVAIPDGHYGRIAPRSGLALNFGLNVGAGVIDVDYRGELKVLIFNHSTNDYQFAVGDRVAQLIIEKISHPQIVEVIKLEETDRGNGGFGSTGR